MLTLSRGSEPSTSEAKPYCCVQSPRIETSTAVTITTQPQIFVCAGRAGNRPRPRHSRRQRFLCVPKQGHSFPPRIDVSLRSGQECLRSFSGGVSRAAPNPNVRIPHHGNNLRKTFCEDGTGPPLSAHVAGTRNAECGTRNPVSTSSRRLPLHRKNLRTISRGVAMTGAVRSNFRIHSQSGLHGAIPQLLAFRRREFVHARTVFLHDEGAWCFLFEGFLCGLHGVFIPFLAADVKRAKNFN